MRETGRARAFVIVVILVVVIGGTLAYVTLGGSNRSTEGLQVVRIWSDAVDAPTGMTFYLLDVNATNGQATGWQVNPSYFALTSNAKSYSAVDNYSEVTLLQPSNVSSGRSVVGDVVFLLPSGEVPSKLTYDDRSGVSLQTNELPPVSGVASRFDPSVHVVFVGTSAANAVASWNGITNQTNGLTFFGGEPGYRNYSFVFFTGQKIYVTFALYYYKFPYDPNSINVTSVTSDDGYAISNLVGWQFTSLSVQPHQLPVTMTGYGSNVEVTLLVTVPPGPQPGVLHFTIQFSA